VFGSHHKDSVFIYISDGIRVVDLPKRLLELGCRDAINMDGGGSTFLYRENKYDYVQTPIKKMRKYPNVLAW
jgi:exopolysaccharide biosynthesis protein